MCRLFGQIALQHRSAFDYLVKRDFSLLRQSNSNRKHLQKDGWGIAGHHPEDGGWRLIKSERPVFHEAGKFAKSAQSVRSPIIITHIRKASNPRKLPSVKLRRIENSQPFSHGRLLFTHNGTLNIPLEVHRTLGEHGKNVAGINDSEVLFWLFVKTWEEYSGMDNPGRLWKKIFKRMLSHLQNVWDGIPKRKRRFSAPYRGLNFVVSDRNSLAALCHYGQSDGKSLCGQDRPFFEMCYKATAEKIAVASEPLDRSRGWRPIMNGHLLVIENRNGSLVPEIQRLN